MVTETAPPILVSYAENIPQEVLDAFRNAVAERLDLRLESRPPAGPQAGLEWLLPTAVVIFLAKAYFDAFLKEAGKDHYHLLKSGMLSLWHSLISPDRKVNLRIVSTGGKITDSRYSLALSVMAEAADGYRFKLLIDNSVGEEEFNAVISIFLDFLAAYYSNRLDAKLTNELREKRVVGRTILIAYDKDREALCVVTPIPRDSKQS
jgi:hypothetical protein